MIGKRPKRTSEKKRPFVHFFASAICLELQYLRLASYYMRRLPLLPIRRFGPGFLEAGVHGGVDDAGLGDLRAGEEDEFHFVKYAV